MDRPFLFMAGEFGVSMPLVFSRDLWQHTMSPSELVFEIAGGSLRRKDRPGECLKGVIFYADMGDKPLELQNINLLSANKIPCWPSPGLLSRMYNRHAVLLSLADAGLVTHPTFHSHELPLAVPFQYPFVIKEGLHHRGHGKHLVRREEDWPQSIEPGLCTIEPYFEGASVRVLKIGHRTFGIQVDNETTWIKNMAGAEISRFPLAGKYTNLRRHARAVSDFLNLEVAGLDYIVEPNGAFHFLEANHFPGLNLDDEIAAEATQFLRMKMDLVEAAAK